MDFACLLIFENLIVGRQTTCRDYYLARSAFYVFRE